MNKITCDICADLLPLVQDGVATDDSRNAVINHIQECPDCRALYQGEIPVPSNGRDLLNRIQRSARTFWFMVLMFGIFYGLMLTAGSGLFMNLIIMPMIGGIGYCLFRWKALVILPPLLLGTHFITNALGLGGEYLAPGDVLLWTAIYCGIAAIGFIIAALLHFVFKKEND